MFRLTGRAVDALRLFYREAHALGLVTATGAPAFF